MCMNRLFLYHILWPYGKALQFRPGFSWHKFWTVVLNAEAKFSQVSVAKSV